MYYKEYGQTVIDMNGAMYTAAKYGMTAAEANQHPCGRSYIWNALACLVILNHTLACGESGDHALQCSMMLVSHLQVVLRNAY